MSLYKSEATKIEVMRLYDAKLAACGFSEYEDKYVDTEFGQSHVIITGKRNLPPLVVFHGINAGAPMALEAIKHLTDKYCLYGVDTIGQATKSAENRLPMQGDAYGKWICQTLDGLGLDKVNVCAISYGAFILQKLMQYQPERLMKAIFVVPSGFVSGSFWRSMKELSWPLMKFLRSKKDADLKQFLKAFYLDSDPHFYELQKALLLGFKMDYRRPVLVKDGAMKQVICPVYVMVADDDIFFPGDKTLIRCKQLFSNLRDIYTLKNSKHIPSLSRYDEIETKLSQWLQD